MPTKQQTYDTVARFIYDQGKPAYDGGDCRYRTEDGCKCAAGCLIPDDQYTAEMENVVIDPYYKEGPSAEFHQAARCLYDLGHDLRLVSMLQNAHDTIADNPLYRDAGDEETFREIWVENLIGVSLAVGLEPFDPEKGD